MAVFSGPKIVDNGLIFYYDVSNTQRSWKGKPTINLAPNTNYSNRTYYIVYNIGGWGGDDADVYYYPNSGWNDLPYKKMVKHTGGSGGSFIDEHSFFTLEEGKTYTISCYMKANKTVTVSGHALALNRNSDNQYRVPVDFNLTTEWVKQQWTYTCGVGEGGTTYHFRQIIYNDTNLPVEVYWCALQIEEGTYSTPYVNGTRSNTQVLIDISGNNNLITANSVIYYSNNTFSFDGTTSRFTTTNSTYSANSTWEAVINCEESVNTFNMFMGQWPPYISFYNGNRLYFSNQISNVQRTIQTPANMTTNKWYHAAFVATYDSASNNTVMSIYTNGVQTATGTFSGVPNNHTNLTIGDGRTNSWYPFKGKVDIVKKYNRELTAAEISQNFEAIRSRYGI